MPIDDTEPGAEPLEQPAGGPSERPAKLSLPKPDRQPVPPLRPFPYLSFLAVCLFILLMLPYVAERVQYALTRGYHQARADVARRLLAESPHPESRFAHVAMKVEPSVVGIETVESVRLRSRREAGSRHEPRTTGIGSGVIVDETGYIVTNLHVIADAEAVVVELSDGRIVDDVTVVGVDRPSDLAVLKINAGKLTAAEWGDSEKLEPGDQVLAVGSPFGLAHTVTAGIISAKDRPASTRMAYQDFLQTDTAINPGSSGGPLVNLDGDVVGINTAILGETYQGISFAIPSRLAREVYEQLIEKGKVDRGYLGVGSDRVTQEMAQRLGLGKARGVLVAHVEKNTPAQRAGMTEGDVILQWNGQEIGRPRDLGWAVVTTRIGSEATARVFRDGGEIELTVVVGRWPERRRQ
jgi:serine protease Do